MNSTDVSQRWQSRDVAERYDAERFSGIIGRFFHNSQCRAMRRSLAQLNPASRVADVPVGTGRMLPLLAEAIPSIVAIDVSEAMMQQARERVRGLGGIEFLRGDARHLPLERCSVDGVVSIRFFMHLTREQRVEILREYRRITRNWILVEYDCDSPWHKIRRALRTFLLAMLGRKQSAPRSTPKRGIIEEAREAGLSVCRWHWTLRALSESVFVLMEQDGDDNP